MLKVNNINTRATPLDIISVSAFYYFCNATLSKYMPTGPPFLKKPPFFEEIRNLRKIALTRDSTINTLLRLCGNFNNIKRYLSAPRKISEILFWLETSKNASCKCRCLQVNVPFYFPKMSFYSQKCTETPRPPSCIPHYQAVRESGALKLKIWCPFQCI